MPLILCSWKRAPYIAGLSTRLISKDPDREPWNSTLRITTMLFGLHSIGCVADKSSLMRHSKRKWVALECGVLTGLGATEWSLTTEAGHISMFGLTAKRVPTISFRAMRMQSEAFGVNCTTGTQH